MLNIGKTHRQHRESTCAHNKWNSPGVLKLGSNCSLTLLAHKWDGKVWAYFIGNHKHSASYPQTKASVGYPTIFNFEG